VNSVDVSTRGFPKPSWSGKLEAYCRKALREQGIDGWEVSVVLCDDVTIRDLSARYRGKDSATDVLSFRQADGPGAGDPCVVGDLVISMESMRRNAASAGVQEDAELKRLVVHGLLHLAGMDHGTGRGGKMLELQEELLTALPSPRILAARARR
jgi:probable rRNA maturation factor